MEDMVQIIIKARVVGDHDEVLSLARIDMSRKYVEYLIGKITKASELHEEDHDFYSMEYFDGSVDWYSDFQWEKAIGEGGFCRLQEIVGEFHAVFDPPVAPDNKEFWIDKPDYHQYWNQIVAECATLHVKEKGLYWTAYRKHTPTQFETEEISLEMLTALLKGEIETHKPTEILGEPDKQEPQIEGVTLTEKDVAKGKFFDKEAQG